MGELIQIRVSAGTLYPEKVLERWPKLAKLGFGALEDRDLEQRELVQMLIDALQERMQTAQLPEDLDQSLLQDIAQAFFLKKRLVYFLGQWNPREADRAAYQIEDQLDAMEEKLLD